ncbi:hypothetical protein A6C57_01280 [Fibrella sp. ES10-3-2-2]|nr:hypothetical protein A6C57_01280 [Fibrella sp. ES10-3-2-2]
MPNNQINTYTCGKGHVTVTRDVDEGVTPMNKNCPTCGQPARSGWYNVDQLQTPTHEWYKPRHPERYNNPNMREHCQKGGLAFRAVGEPDETLSMTPLSLRGTPSKTIFHRLTNKKRSR